MQLTISTLKGKLEAKLRCLFRLRKFYSLSQYLNMYKTQIWSSVEWATPRIYHCTKTQLDVIDRIQRRFLRFVGLSEKVAFLDHNIGPLSLRRSIAMLGFIYRCVHGQAPRPCCILFTLNEHRNVALRSSSRLHTLQLVDPVKGSSSPMMRRSILGLVAF